MTNQELFNLANVMTTLKDKKSTKFGYAIMKNLEKIDRISRDLTKQSTFEREDEIKLFEKERIDILTDLSNKDENGKPVIKDNNFDLTPENLELFNTKFAELREKNKELLEAKIENENFIKTLLEKESDYVIYKVDYSDLPKDLTAEDLHSITPLIKNLPQET